MNAADRAGALAAAARHDRAALLALADQVRGGATDPWVIAGPTVGTLLLELESATGSAYLGEIVVTTAEATCGAARGWACVLGADEPGALAAAVCDAAAHEDAYAGEVAELAARAVESERAEHARARAVLAMTRLGVA